MNSGRSPLVAEIRATLAIATPLAAANLAHMAMHVTNTVMVGHLGAVSLAAAGLGSALYATLLMLCQGVLEAVAPAPAPPTRPPHPPPPPRGAAPRPSVR